MADENQQEYEDPLGFKAVLYLEITYDPFDSSIDDKIEEELSKIKDVQFKRFDLYNEITDRILKIGLTNIINPEHYHFVGEPNRRDDFINAMQKFLDEIILSDTLIIVDGYIFPKRYDDEYISLFLDILKKYVTKLQKIEFITSTGFNKIVQAEIFEKILKCNPLLSLSIKESEEIHDRFWINPQHRKGIFMGTSLNGIGKKYTLVDYIKEEDMNILLPHIEKIQ